MIRNTLTALALTATVAQPAQANDDLAKILFGVIVGAAIVDATKNTPRPVYNTHTTNDYSVERCGYVSQVYYQEHWVITEKRNRCTSELVERSVRPRH